MDDLSQRISELWAKGELEEVVRLSAGEPRALEPRARVRLAAACIRLGELTRAVDLLRDLDGDDGYGALQLGNALRYLGEVEQAAQHLERAYGKAKAGRDGALALASLCALGELALDEGEAREAVERFGQALGLTEFTADEAITVAPLAGLAQAHLLWGTPRKAKRIAEKALHRARDARDKVGEVRALLSLGLILKDSALLEQATAKALAAPHHPLWLRALLAGLELAFDPRRCQQALALAEKMQMRPELLRVQLLQNQQGAI